MEEMSFCIICECSMPSDEWQKYNGLCCECLVKTQKCKHIFDHNIGHSVFCVKCGINASVLHEELGKRSIYIRREK